MKFKITAFRPESEPRMYVLLHEGIESFTMDRTRCQFTLTEINDTYGTNFVSKRQLISTQHNTKRSKTTKTSASPRPSHSLRLWRNEMSDPKKQMYFAQQVVGDLLFRLYNQCLFNSILRNKLKTLNNTDVRVVKDVLDASCGVLKLQPRVVSPSTCLIRIVDDVQISIAWKLIIEYVLPTTTTIKQLWVSNNCFSTVMVLSCTCLGLKYVLENHVRFWTVVCQ